MKKKIIRQRFFRVIFFVCCLILVCTQAGVSGSNILNGQEPFKGHPSVVPGEIEAEEFDTGGEGVAYHDTDEGNNGGAFREEEDVDIERATEGEFNIGWIQEGEWAEYTVDVLASGLYTLEIRIASQSSGGQLHIEFDGENITGAVDLPVTGGWQEWETVTVTGFTLEAGQHIMRWVSESGGYNVNSYKFFKIVDTDVPVIEITSPTDGQKLPHYEDIQITADASDPDGHVTRVEFFTDNFEIGEDRTAPFEILWEDVSGGEYTITAIATDNDGARSKPDSVRIKVRAQDFPDILNFSKTRGFYSEKFDVVVTSDSSDAEIHYTLDGSDPRISYELFEDSSPATIEINPASAYGRARTPAVVLRAYAVKEGRAISKVVAHTYIYLDRVKTQSHPGGDWPGSSINGQGFDYDMDSRVVNDTRYRNDMDEALLSIPTFSISTDLDNLFDPETGIYVNADFHGPKWERPASVELINPENSDGFQIEAGLRIRGGWSRHNYNPKHAFRLFFRKDEYGAGKLNYPLFGDEGVDEFDKIDLRTSQNYAWSLTGSDLNTMNRDVFSRDVQREMGHPYTRSRYYHLYINGLYWGLYQTQERSEASWGAKYLGGEREDYDVVKVDIGDYYNIYEIEATDGTLDAWQEIWTMSERGFTSTSDYLKLQGLDPDGERNPGYRVLVDIENLIDYMIVIFYAGNFDAPVSKFGSNKSPNNFYAVYNRNRNDGFMFLAHDAEHTLMVNPVGPGIGLQENRVNIGNSNDRRMVVDNFGKFHPQWLHHRLTVNRDYRMSFADRAFKHLFNNGVLTTDRAISLFMSRAEEIEMAIIAESARWGDAKHSPPRTKNNDWIPALESIVEDFFPPRLGILVEQLKDENLYPDLSPPVFKKGEQELRDELFRVSPGYTFTLENTNSSKLGSIHYTLDGADPRQFGGALNGKALDGGDEKDITITSITIVKSRIKNGSQWSALHEKIFSVPENLAFLKLTEIHYNPLDEVEISGREFEFIELKNTGGTTVNLTKSEFVSGIKYTFAESALLDPGEFIVLASNKQQFERRYGFSPFGEFEGQLDNGGERIVLLQATGDTSISMRYNDKAPWPTLPDSLGYSLVSKEKNAVGDPGDPVNWRASHQIHGSPGTDDPASDVDGTMFYIPETYELLQNFPNPFNESTFISFSLPKAVTTRLVLYDILGREVEKLVDDFYPSGNHTVMWSNSELASGIYFYQLTAEDFSETKKLVLIK